MTDRGGPKKPSSTMWLLLVGLLLAAGGYMAFTLMPSPGVSREQQAEERAALLREQSVKESPTPVTPEVVVDPNVPPTRGPMGSPPRR